MVQNIPLVEQVWVELGGGGDLVSRGRAVQDKPSHTGGKRVVVPRAYPTLLKRRDLIWSFLNAQYSEFLGFSRFHGFPRFPQCPRFHGVHGFNGFHGFHGFCGFRGFYDFLGSMAYMNFTVWLVSTVSMV